MRQDSGKIRRSRSADRDASERRLWARPIVVALLAVTVALLLSRAGWPTGADSGATRANAETLTAGVDPVIAAAGDIACDPANSAYNSGNGTSNACRQKYTSDLLVNGGYSAVLPLGDNQYYCGGYSGLPPVLRPDLGTPNVDHPSGRRQPRVPHLGRLRPRAPAATRPTRARPATSATSAAPLGARQGLLQLRRRLLAPHRAELELLRRWRLQLDQPAGHLADRPISPLTPTSARSPTGTSLSSARVAGGQQHRPPLADPLRRRTPTWSLRATTTSTSDSRRMRADGTLDPRPVGSAQFIVGTGGANHTRSPVAANSEVRNAVTFGSPPADAPRLQLRLAVRPRGWEDLHRLGNGAPATAPAPTSPRHRSVEPDRPAGPTQVTSPGRRAATTSAWPVSGLSERRSDRHADRNRARSTRTRPRCRRRATRTTWPPTTRQETCRAARTE